MRAFSLPRLLTIFSVLNRMPHKRVVSLKRSKYPKLAFTETLPALGQHMMFQTWFLQISSKPRRCLQTGLLAPNNPSLKLGAMIVRFAWSLLFPLLLILTCWLQRTLGWGLGLSGPSRRGTSSIKTAESWEKIENCAENTEHSLAEPRALLYSSSHMPHTGPHVIQGRRQRELGLREVLIQRERVSCDPGPAQKGWPSNNTLQPSLSFVSYFPRRNNRKELTESRVLATIITNQPLLSITNTVWISSAGDETICVCVCPFEWEFVDKREFSCNLQTFPHANNTWRLLQGRQGFLWGHGWPEKVEWDVS